VLKQKTRAYSPKTTARKNPSQAPFSVPPQKAFYFYTNIGAPTGQVASSLEGFANQLKTVNVASIEFHMQRGDFENWIRDVFHNNKLAARLKLIKALGLKGEKLREAVYEEVKRNMAIHPN
jgi:hypothetical protein